MSGTVIIFSFECGKSYYFIRTLNVFVFQLSATIFEILLKLTHYSLVLLFYTPWKHQKTRSIRFSDIFRVYRKAATCCNGLIKCLTIHLQRGQFFGHQICKHQNITSTLIFLRVLGRNCYCSLIYLFHSNFVDLLFFIFLQGKMYSPKKSGSPQRFCASEQFVQAWFGKWCAKNYEL